MTIKQHIYIPVVCLMILGGGCNASSSIQPAPVIEKTPAIVSTEAAATAPLEPLGQGAITMPCLQFANRDGFLRWLEAYRIGNEETAKNMAQNINLPSAPDSALVKALKDSQPPDAAQTNICTIHKLLELRTWAVQTELSTAISVYYKGGIKQLNIPIDSKGTQAYCLPKTVTDQELVWVCRPDMKAQNWTQVHVNRRSGEMQAIRCETEKDGKTKEAGTGCLK